MSGFSAGMYFLSIEEKSTKSLILKKIFLKLKNKGFADEKHLQNQ
jgi:hypothetical protein